MTIGILTSASIEGSTPTALERLMQTIEARGHRGMILEQEKVGFLYADQNVSVTYDGQPWPLIDVLIVRLRFVEEPTLHIPFLELLQRAGVCLLNGHPDTLLAKNKMMQHVRFAEHGLPLPRWGLARSHTEARTIAEQLGFPLMMKVPFGARGKGVFFADSWKTFLPLADYLFIRDQNPVILEEFVSSTDGKDLRLFVVGGRVVAAMERLPADGDVRANIARGGQGGSVDISDEERQLAIKAAEVFHADVAGVDLMRSVQGLRLLEINTTPGFEELERVTGVDIAGAIIDVVEREA